MKDNKSIVKAKTLVSGLILVIMIHGCTVAEVEEAKSTSPIRIEVLSPWELGVRDVYFSPDGSGYIERVSSDAGRHHTGVSKEKFSFEPKKFVEAESQIWNLRKYAGTSGNDIGTVAGAKGLKFIRCGDLIEDQGYLVISWTGKASVEIDDEKELRRDFSFFGLGCKSTDAIRAIGHIRRSISIINSQSEYGGRQ